MLLRHLLESLVKVEYAQKYKALSERIWHAPGDGAGTVKPLTISSIFSGVGKRELYVSTYGALSAMTHGGATISMFRLERDGGEVKRVRQAMAYSEFYGTYIFNLMLSISLAYLHQFPKYFPAGWCTFPPESRKSYDSSVAWLEEGHKSLLKVNPRFKKLLSNFGDLLTPRANDV